MGLVKYIIRRLLLLVVVLVGVTFVTFCISKLVPGDPLVANLGQAALNNKEIIETYEKKWGLDKPFFEQYLTYVKNFAMGDMGVSIASKRPVLEDLKQYFPATIELATLATIISILMGLLFGIVSATNRNKLPDHGLRAVSLVGISMPAFWLALLFLFFFYQQLKILPGFGRMGMEFSGFQSPTGFLLLDSAMQGNWAVFGSAVSHMIMPAVVLAASTMGVITRTVRSSMLDVLGQDYLRTAKAKGLSPKKVIYKHALKNALIPTITMFGLSYGNLLGGTVLIESIFSYPGLGLYAYTSAKTLDFPAIMGVTVVIATINSVMSLLVDIIYAFVDPRVKY